MKKNLLLLIVALTTFNAPLLTALTNTVVTLKSSTSTLNAPDLANIDNSRFTLSDGAQLTIPAQTYSAKDYSENRTIFSVTGEGTKLSLPNLTTFAATTDYAGIGASATLGGEINLPALTEEDRRNIATARDYGVTGLMQPFVRGRADLEAVRAALDEAGCGEICIFAKVENLEGMEKLPELLGACDELVIARGDLGNAMPLWELPAAQKRISAACRAAGQPFMVVTQMLASMEKSPVPTRAEVSDIFNAVLDGAASVMITGETAAGKYPLEAARYLIQTARSAERYLTEGETK